MFTTFAAAFGRRSVLGCRWLNRFCGICCVGRVCIVAPRNEPEDWTQRVPCFLLCATMGGCADCRRRGVGSEAGPALAEAGYRRTADSGSLRRGIPGLHFTDGNRTGRRVGETSALKVPYVARDRFHHENPATHAKLSCGM